MTLSSFRIFLVESYELIAVSVLVVFAVLILLRPFVNERERHSEQSETLERQLSRLHKPDEIASISLYALGAWLTRVHDQPSNAETMRQHIAGARSALDQIEKLTQHDQ